LCSAVAAAAAVAAAPIAVVAVEDVLFCEGCGASF